MAFTSGFFNSVGGDRKYNAEQMSRIFEGLITSGVYAAVGNKLAVEPNEGMTIQINTGRGWFNWHWVNNDSAYLLTLENSDVLLKRYCAVCIRVDDSDSVREVTPVLKYSEFATNPVKPTVERSELINEYCLAYILIRAGATEISAADIEDARGNTAVCGWVTGLIEQVDTSTLWAQYKAQWEEFMSEKNSEAAEYMSEQQAEFETWYNNLRATLEGDVAANLSQEIESLKNEMESHAKRSSGTFNGLGWNSGEDGYYTQTINIEGVTADNDVLLSPASEDRETYINMGCEPVSQGAGTITFRCTAPEDVAVKINAIIFNL